MIDNEILSKLIQEYQAKESFVFLTYIDAGMNKN